MRRSAPRRAVAALRCAARHAKIPQMQVPSASILLDKIRSLPAAMPLLDRLGEQAGVYLVGGAVRDLLRGGEPADLDLLVERDAGQLAARLGGRLRVHDRFGTSTVELNGHSYDIARARQETYARPGALPDVTPATVIEDLLRRDFTVNAMAIALTGRTAGELHAAPLALEDLDAGLLRVLHERSFIDDPTRLLRLVRYAARLRLQPETHTLELVQAAIRAHALQTVSGARTGTELRLLAREPDPVAAFQTMRALALDHEIDPDFGIDDPESARAALALVAPDAGRDRVALAAAARALPASRLRSMLQALAFEADDRDAIVEAATRAEQLADALAAARTPSEIAIAAQDSRPETVALAGALGAAKQARAWLEQLRHVALEIDGNDLVRAGVSPGPAIGAGLRAALLAKLDGRAVGRDQELAEALRAAGAKG